MPTVESRRMIAIGCAALVAVTLVGVLIFSLGSVGNGCGNGWAASKKQLPEPLLTVEEQERIKAEKLNPYEFSVAKAKPINDCRRAGSKRLLTSAGVFLFVLLPVMTLLAYLYWPRRDELTDIYLYDDDDDEPDPEPPSTRRSSWGDYRPGG